MKWMLKFTVFGLLIWTTDAYAFDPCEDTIVHKPRADVDYNPRGKSLSVIPEKIQIPITVDLAERFDIDIPLGADFDTNFGFIEIDEQGGIFYNGEDISSDIKDKCDNDSDSPETAEQSEKSKDGDHTDTDRELP